MGTQLYKHCSLAIKFVLEDLVETPKFTQVADIQHIWLLCTCEQDLLLENASPERGRTTSKYFVSKNSERQGTILLSVCSCKLKQLFIPAGCCGFIEKWSKSQFFVASQKWSWMKRNCFRITCRSEFQKLWLTHVSFRPPFYYHVTDIYSLRPL